VISDLDADGLDEAAVTRERVDAVLVLTPDAMGRLVERQRIDGLDDPADLGRGDFDGDGDLDVAVLLGRGTPAARVLVLENDGAGVLSPGPSAPDPNLDRLVDVEDWTGDGARDLLSQSGIALRFAAGDGASGFGTPREVARVRVVRGPKSGDIDGDGHRDLVDFDTTRVLIYRGDGRGGFAVPIASGPSASVPLALADVNGDGRLDAAHGGGSLFDVSVRLGAGDGSFVPPSAATVGFQPMDVVAADFDRDGAIDLAVTDAGGGRVAVLGGDGSGVPGAGGTASFAAGPRPDDLVSADFNRDGDLDLLVVNRAASRGGLGTATFLRGDGAGGFLASAPVPAGADPEFLAAADFDADGNLDAAVGKTSGSAYFVLRGNGSGGFTPAASSIWPGDDLRALITGDFDADGFADIAFDVFFDKRVHVHFGNGAFGFTFAAAGTPNDPSALAAADLNGDGNLDIASTSGDVITGDGEGGFRATGFEFGGAGADIAIGDVDGGGRADIVLSSVIAVLDRTFDPVRVRRGNVNAERGPLADVVLVNGSPGLGDRRQVEVPRGERIELFVMKPPGKPGERSPFAMYAWRAKGTPATVGRLPFGLGYSILPTPLVPGRAPMPRRIWNNGGHFAILGAPDLSSSASPSVVFSLASGLAVPVTVTFQGIIVDPAAPNGLAATTNAVELVVR